MTEPLAQPKSRTAFADELYCPDCGYSLRGLTSERCPECGLVLDFIERGESAIPWEHRKRIGWFRAYWKTVFMVLFRNKLLCREMYRAVNYADAQRFRAVSIALATVGAGIVVAALHVHAPNLLPSVVAEMGLWYVAFCAFCLVLALVAFTGIPSYFFHPRRAPVEVQDRTVALSYYGCASLAMCPLIGLLILLGALQAKSWPVQSRDLVFFIGASLGGAIPLGSCWALWMRIMRTTLRPWRGLWGLRLVLPMLWLVVCGFVLLVLPFLAFLVGLIVYSVL